MNTFEKINLEKVQAKLKEVYHPGVFKVATHAFAELVETELRKGFDGTNTKTRRFVQPEELLTLARQLLVLQDSQSQGDEEPIARAKKMAEALLKYRNQLHSKKYVGHQVGPPIPLAAAFELVTRTTNSSSAIYEMGPFPVAVEKVLNEILGQRIGWRPGSFDGIFTHGGALGNFTALLTARNHHDKSIWKEGLKNKRLAIVVGQDSHYSVSRSAGMLGLGADQVILAPLNEQRQVDITKLPELIRQTKDSGLEIFCLVGTAGTTPIGAIDDLKAMSEIAQENNFWFHVDGAHGASLLFSRRHKDKLRGIQQADSIVWDAHKMHFVPSLCTFVLYKNGNTSYETFQQEAPYIFGDKSPWAGDFNPGQRTLECTKPAIAMDFACAYAAYGPEVFENLIDVTLELTQRFHQMLSETPDFEAIHVPETNILCFRYVPDKSKSSDEISDLQLSVREELIKDGEYYTTATKLNGQNVLRVTLMNPLTTPQHLQGLLEKIRSLKL